MALAIKLSSKKQSGLRRGTRIKPLRNDAVAQSVDHASPIDKVRRRAILVLGMHRSGTSAVSGVSVILGSSPPMRLMGAMAENPKGFWESWAIVEAHNQLLSACNSKWDDWRGLDESTWEPEFRETWVSRLGQLYNEDYGEAPLTTIKDPRVCRFAPLWLQILQQMDVSASVIIPIRHPLEVAQSLRTRDCFSINKGLVLWLRHVLDAELASRNVPRSFVIWHKFVVDWRTQAARISSETGVVWPRSFNAAADEVDAFLSDALYRERFDATKMDALPPVHDLVERAYEAFSKLEYDVKSAIACDELDIIRKEFDSICELMSFQLGDLQNIEVKYKSAQIELVSMKHSLAESQSISRDLEQDNHALEASLSELRLTDEARSSQCPSSEHSAQIAA